MENMPADILANPPVMVGAIRSVIDWYVERGLPGTIAECFREMLATAAGQKEGDPPDFRELAVEQARTILDMIERYAQRFRLTVLSRY